MRATRPRVAAVSPARQEAAARQIMEASPPRVPPGLYADALRRGVRARRRRTVARRLGWGLLCAVVAASAVWALTVRPWAEPPSETTPPVPGWAGW